MEARPRIHAGLAQQRGEVFGAAEDQRAGATNGQTFQRRIEPGSTSLVDVEIDKVPIAGDHAGQHADHVTHDDDPVIAPADRAQEPEGGRDSPQPAGHDVPPKRSLDVPPAFGGQSGPWPHNRANAVIGLAAADHWIGFCRDMGRQVGDQLGRYCIFTMTV